MADSLSISSTSRLFGATSERKQHLKKIGFQKGYSGNPKGRPKLDKKLKQIVKIYSVDCIYALIDIVRDKSNSAYTRLQAARAILSAGWNKNKRLRDLNLLEIEKFMYVVELHYGLHISRKRSWELAEHLISENPTIKNRATELALEEKDMDDLWDL